MEVTVDSRLGLMDRVPDGLRAEACDVTAGRHPRPLPRKRNAKGKIAVEGRPHK